MGGKKRDHLLLRLVLLVCFEWTQAVKVDNQPAFSTDRKAVETDPALRSLRFQNSQCTTWHRLPPPWKRCTTRN
nr:unnamed protein product [Spirometra erinaceieuropaei]